MQQQLDASKNIATLSDELSIGLSIDESTWCDHNVDYHSVDADIVEHREMEDGSIELEKDASSYNQMEGEKLYLNSLPKMKEQENSQAGLTCLQYTPRRCGNHQHQPSSCKIEYYSTSTSSESGKGKSPNHGDHETKRHSLICYTDICCSSSINSSSSSQS